MLKVMETRVWERFFDHHAPKYDAEPFTTGTEEEITFLLELLEERDIPVHPGRRSGAGARILDLGCGTGRHAVALAERGFTVTGVDLSRGMLDQAAGKAQKAGVGIDLVHEDARRYDGAGAFHVVICLCEGSMGLMGVAEEPHEHDAAVLATIFRALRPGGTAVINALSAWRFFRTHSQEEVEAGAFDPGSITEVYPMEYETPTGTESVQVKEKAYLPEEFTGLVENAGLAVEALWGGTAGRWGRRPLELDDYEMMVLARRPYSA